MRDVDGQPLALGGPQQRALLAVLLVNANRVVSTDRLISWLWGEDPPTTARGLLQGCVAQLRRALLTTEDGAARQPLLTRPPGYLSRSAPASWTWSGSTSTCRAAHRCLAEQSTEGVRRAAAALREAASLWRGPTLEDIAVDVCRREAVRLDERRLAVEEERVELDLRLGRHRDLIGELRAGGTRPAAPGEPMGAAHAGPVWRRPAGRGPGRLSGAAADPRRPARC